MLSVCACRVAAVGDVEAYTSESLPEEYVDLVRAERAALWREVALVRASDRDALWVTAERIRRRLDEGEDETGGHLREHVGDILAALDEHYDAVFPPEAADGITGLLAAPWPSARRHALVAAYLGVDVRHRLVLDEVAAAAIAAVDLDLLRALVSRPLGWLDRDSVARVLDALYLADALDASLVERAFTDDRYLGYAIVGRNGSGEITGAALACADSLRALVDSLTWRLATEHASWDAFPKGFAPRGLRFVRLALSWPGEPRVAEHLGTAELTDPERTELLDELRAHPVTVRRTVFGWRGTAGDAESLLPLFDLADSARLLRLIRAIPTDTVVRQDRAALLAAIEEAGHDNARRLLDLVPSELVSAVLGANRAQVEKRVKHHALHGIAAFGMLPLAPGETVLDRYLTLRESAKKGVTLGPNRRISHAAAIEVALDHLAQVAGTGDPGRLEWDCEARIATATPTEATIGDYRILLRFTGAEPELQVARGTKTLRSVPRDVRADPAYRALREHQDRLRDQARRMRSGLLERLVATGATVTPEDLARWRSLPAGAALLPALLWRDRAGTIGFLDEIDTTAPIAAVHPVDLCEQGTLAAWRERLTGAGLDQPVKQVFREVYPLTAAERATGDVSRRFDGRVVDGARAVALLSGRGWTTHGRYDDHQASRPAGAGLVAALRCDIGGYFGQGRVEMGELRFLADGRAVALDSVPPAAFSEVVRDLDLVVSVADAARDA